MSLNEKIEQSTLEYENAKTDYLNQISDLNGMVVYLFDFNFKKLIILNFNFKRTKTSINNCKRQVPV